MPPASPEPDPRPLVVSLCGTYLKPEMQSLYRQIANLRRFRNAVFTETVENAEMFPFDSVIKMTKQERTRIPGNFLLRFYWKHIKKVWPPPKPIGKQPPPFYPYNLVDLLHKHKPALVHVYYGHKAVKYLPMLKVWGGPFLVSFHGVDVVKFIDREGYADQLREVFACAKLVLARSHSLLERLRDLGCPPEKLRLNRTPIPLDRIEFLERTAPRDDEWRLVQACRLIHKKGLFTTLEALPLVLEKFPKLKFIICGVGPDEKKLREAISTKGLGDHVVLPGWMNQKDLLDTYRYSHVFLHPSELTHAGDQEGIPNSMLEAMAAGLPVIATTHGGIPEAVTHGSDGYLVPERSPQQLARAIIALLSSPETLAAFSRQASVSVRENFGLERQVAALEDAYAEAAGIKPDPDPAA